MSDNAVNVDRSERADRMMTVASGWAAVVLAVLGVHRWVAEGAMDWWARAGLILAAGLGIMWVWGYWPQIGTRLRAWVRGGGLNTTVIAVGLIVALVIVNTMARRRMPVKWDLTQNQRFTLAPRSREILKSLKSPVKATVFIPAGRSTAPARDLFKQYADASDRFTWTHVDPLVDQVKLLQMKPTLNPTDLTGAVLEYGGKRQDVNEFTEKEVTSAILKMTRDTQRKILFLRGHGEAEVEGGTEPAKSVQMLVADLKGLGWPVEGVDLYGDKATTPDPDQVAVLVIAGPERELVEDEQKRINEYLEKGGDVLLLLDPGGPPLTKFLQPWGIKTTNDIVLDQTQQGLVVVQADRDAHEAVRTARRVLFQPLRSVTAISPAPKDITVTELLKSGPMSEYVENVPPGTGSIDVRNTKPGPIGLAALAEKKLGTGDDAKTARLIVVGDSVFMADQLTRLPGFFNLALASGLVNYLGEEDALVAIPPKDENTEQAFLTPNQGRLLSLIHLWDFPLLALILAIVVYLKRR
jgi:ABC-type uncharacterized transport system involved in gliding motility auxiliary subunit